MKKKINKKEEKENQVIENNIKINIDLNDLKAKPEKKKKRRVKKKKPLNPEDLLKSGANSQSSSMPPKPFGSVKMPSTDNPYNPNNNANMIIATAFQKALEKGQLYNNNPPQQQALPAPPQPPALPAPPQQLLITAPPQQPPTPQQPPPVSQPQQPQPQPPPPQQPQPISFPSMSAFTPNPPPSPENSLFSTGFFNFATPSPSPQPSLNSTLNLPQPNFTSITQQPPQPPPSPPACSPPRA